MYQSSPPVGSLQAETGFWSYVVNSREPLNLVTSYVRGMCLAVRSLSRPRGVAGRVTIAV